MKTLKAFLAGLALATAVGVLAQTYNFFPPPGMTYNSTTHQIGHANLQPAGATSQVQYNASGSLAGDTDLTYVPSSASPTLTIGDSSAALSATPSLTLLNGGTGNGNAVFTDDTVFFIGPTATSPAGIQDIILGMSSIPTSLNPPPTGTNVVRIGASQDSFVMASGALDMSWAAENLGAAGNNTAAIGVTTDTFGSTGIGASIVCTNKGGTLATVGGSFHAATTPISGAPAGVPGCMFGINTTGTGITMGFNTGNHWRGGIDISGNWTIGQSVGSGAAAITDTFGDNNFVGSVTNIVGGSHDNTEANGVPIHVGYTGTTGSIGGSALAAGACAAGTATVTGATSSMTATASPSADPDSTLTTGIAIYSFVSASNTVTVRVCAIVAVTPAAVTYNVRVVK